MKDEKYVVPSSSLLLVLTCVNSSIYLSVSIYICCYSSQYGGDDYFGHLTCFRLYSQNRNWHSPNHTRNFPSINSTNQTRQ